MLAQSDAPAPELVSVMRTAKYLGVTDRYVRKLIAEGELPAMKLGAKVIRIRATDVEALLRPVAL